MLHWYNLVSKVRHRSTGVRLLHDQALSQALRHMAHERIRIDAKPINAIKTPCDIDQLDKKFVIGPVKTIRYQPMLPQ